jgi:hypothetical protein
VVLASTPPEQQALVPVTEDYIRWDVGLFDDQEEEPEPGSPPLALSPEEEAEADACLDRIINHAVGLVEELLLYRDKKWWRRPRHLDADGKPYRRFKDWIKDMVGHGDSWISREGKRLRVLRFIRQQPDMRHFTIGTDGTDALKRLLPTAEDSRAVGGTAVVLREAHDHGRLDKSGQITGDGILDAVVRRRMFYHGEHAAPTYEQHLEDWLALQGVVAPEDDVLAERVAAAIAADQDARTPALIAAVCARAFCLPPASAVVRYLSGAETVDLADRLRQLDASWWETKAGNQEAIKHYLKRHKEHGYDDEYKEAITKRLGELRGKRKKKGWSPKEGKGKGGKGGKPKPKPDPSSSSPLPPPGPGTPAAFPSVTVVATPKEAEDQAQGQPHSDVLDFLKEAVEKAENACQANDWLEPAHEAHLEAIFHRLSELTDTANAMWETWRELWGERELPKREE